MDQLDGSVFPCVKLEFGEVDVKRFFAVECAVSGKPIFLKNGKEEEFYIRAGASSPVLPGSHTHDYTQQHFK